MGRKATEHYTIKLGANSDTENLAKLSNIYNEFKARMILKYLENYPEEIREEVLKRLQEDRE